ncbi:hypothetical protein PM082_024056 [Marasmius tenuissimus]|nr:hypothetical protein PM082_024056 [Marasmius tenuissimus]
MKNGKSPGSGGGSGGGFGDGLGTRVRCMDVTRCLRRGLRPFVQSFIHKFLVHYCVSTSTMNGSMLGEHSRRLSIVSYMMKLDVCSKRRSSINSSLGCHYICKCVADCKVDLFFIDSAYNPVDMFTKNLDALCSTGAALSEGES